jgi:hypothetical protein
MRLSSLVVVLLSVSQVLFAQHSSSGGGGGSHSSSSHGSSSGSHTSSTHSSGGSVSRSSSTSASKGSAASSRDKQPSVSGSAKVTRGLKQTGEKDHDAAERSRKPQPEHKGVFAFLHHRHRKPEPGIVTPAVENEHRHRVCPPGQSAGKKGSCMANATTNAATQCSANAPGVPCANTADQCLPFRGQLNAAAAELRSINTEMRNAGCSGAAPGQECDSLSQRRNALVAQYRSTQSGIPANCRALLPDPLSL